MNDYLKTKKLYHHGIKGQKWGVRRYQNEDGSLTEEGEQLQTAGRIGTVVGAVTGLTVGYNVARKALAKHTWTDYHDGRGFISAVSGESLSSLEKKSIFKTVGAAFVGGFLGKHIAKGIAKSSIKKTAKTTSEGSVNSN